MQRTSETRSRQAGRTLVGTQSHVSLGSVTRGRKERKYIPKYSIQYSCPVHLYGCRHFLLCGKCAAQSHRVADFRSSGRVGYVQRLWRHSVRAPQAKQRHSRDLASYTVTPSVFMQAVAMLASPVSSVATPSCLAAWLITSVTCSTHTARLSV